MKPLVDKINRYFQTEKGKASLADFSRVANEAILHAKRKSLAKEIASVRERYETVNMYDNGILYPLSYRKNGRFEGMVQEINGVFTQLTGIDVRVGDFGCGEAGMTAALEKIRNGQLHLSLGGYASTAQHRKNGLDFSQTLWIDSIRYYSYKKPLADLGKARIGTSPNLANYFLWNKLNETPPAVYGSRSNLLKDLKKGKLDAVVIGEMGLHYERSVLKDFHLHELEGPSAQIQMHLIYGSQNEELNRLFDESIRLYHVMYPDAREQWEKLAERSNADYTRYRLSYTNKRSYLILGLIVFIAIVVFLYYRTKHYDSQIRQLLQSQQTFDLAWVDLNKKTFISKANHPFFRSWGLKFSGATCSIEEMSRVFGRDVEQEYRNDLEKIKTQGLSFIINDGEVVSPLDGQTKYYRRYIHRLSDSRLMLGIHDIHSQHESEQQEQFLIQLFDAFKEGLLFIDKDFNVLRYNNAMTELFPLHDSTKKHCYACFRGQFDPCSDCPVRETFEDGQKHSRTEFSEDTGRWLELNSYPIFNTKTGKVDRVLEFVLDVTERHNRETELEQQKKFLEAILDASNDGIVAISESKDGTHINSRLIDMFDGQGASFFSNDKPEICALHKRMTLNPEEIYEARDRNRLTQEPQQGTLYFHDGRIYQWRLASTQTGIGRTGWTRVWTYRDVTEEKRITRRIQESEKKFRALFEQMPNGLALFDVVCDEDGQPLEFVYSQINPALERIDRISNEAIPKRRIRHESSR